MFGNGFVKRTEKTDRERERVGEHCKSEGKWEQ